MGPPVGGGSGSNPILPSISRASAASSSSNQSLETGGALGGGRGGARIGGAEASEKSLFEEEAAARARLKGLVDEHHPPVVPARPNAAAVRPKKDVNLIHAGNNVSVQNNLVGGKVGGAPVIPPD